MNHEKITDATASATAAAKAPMTTGGVSGAARVSGSRYTSGVYGVTRRSRIRRSAAFSCRRVTAAV